MTSVVIIGGGPAGLGAAEALARAGASSVIVLERQAQAGGVPRLCGHSPFGMREFHSVLGGRAYANRLQKAAEQAGAQVWVNHSVTLIEPGPVAHVATPKGQIILRPDRVLLATGAREASRAERLLPGDRPLGVVTTGALQDLWFGRRAVPFRRPVILGSELVSMSAILTCRQAGAPPLAVIESGPSAVATAPFRWLPRVSGLPLLTCTRIVDLVAKDGRLDHLVIQSADGSCRRLDCDGLVLTGGFRPEAGLARSIGLEIDPATGGPSVDQSGRTSMAGIYAAGNLLRGIETAGWCWAEGRAVARALLADLGQGAADAIALRAGQGLRYVMPQRLSGQGTSALRVVQVRLDQPSRGTLTLRDGAGRVLRCYQTASGPERRIGFALEGLNMAAVQGPLTLAMEDR